MKRIILLFCLLGGFARTTVAQTTGVGINTENLQGVLHIDAASNNPPTGAINSTEAADDVVIDGSGRVGLGVLSPSVRLDVNGSVRIKNGEEGAGKVFISDADGTGVWTEMAESWYGILFRSIQYNTLPTGDRPFINFEDSVLSSSANGAAVNKQAGSITVPFDGCYRITLSSHWMNSAVLPYKGEASLRVNGIERWTPSTWGGYATNGTYPSSVAIMDLDAGDELTSFAKGTDLDHHAQNGRVYIFGVELLQKR